PAGPERSALPGVGGGRVGGARPPGGRIAGREGLLAGLVDELVEGGVRLGGIGHGGVRHGSMVPRDPSGARRAARRPTARTARVPARPASSDAAKTPMRASSASTGSS